MGAFVLPGIGAVTSSAATGAAAGAAAVGGAGAGAGVSVGLLSNPVTAIAGIGLGLFTAIDGIFRSNHAKAVQTQSVALNDAVPRVQQSIAAVFAALNAGQVSQSTAETALQSIDSNYQTLVYKDYGVKQKGGNGPDVLDKNYIQPWLTNAENVVAAGAGTVTIGGLAPDKTGFTGTPVQTFSFNMGDGLATPTATPASSTTAPYTVPPALSLSPVATSAQSGAIPVLTSPASGVNWGSILLWGGIILAALWALKHFVK